MRNDELDRGTETGNGGSRDSKTNPEYRKPVDPERLAIIAGVVIAVAAILFAIL